jgi:hypothetical protein
MIEYHTTMAQGITTRSNKGMKLTSVESIGRSQLIPGVRPTARWNPRFAVASSGEVRVGSQKATDNLKKHGVWFDEASTVLRRPTGCNRFRS